MAAPNFVVFMTDDLDEGSLDRVLGLGLMPHLEQHLADTGTRFTQSFVSTAWCCPSRATFFSGLYSHNHNVLTNGRPLGGVRRFNDSSTLATWLHDAGYRTGLVGKYLNGYGRDSDPNTPLDDATYVPPGWDDWQSIIHQQVFKLYDYTLNDNGVLMGYGSAPGDYQTDVLAVRAVEFIDESEALDDSQPFFLIVGTITPHLEIHAPMLPGCTNSRWNPTIRPAPRHVGTLPAAVQLPRPPSFNETDMADKPTWLAALAGMSMEDEACLERQYRDRLESMRAVDDLIGAVVDALVQNGELDNTVLIFTSDNGFFFGEHRLSDKVHVYEEAIRVPLFIRAPGITGPQASDRFVLNNDLAPTIAALAGVIPGLTVDGRSLQPLLQNPVEPDWRKQVLIEYRGDAQFSERYGPREPFTAVRTSPLAAVPDHVYVEYTDAAGSRELYDLAADPHQLDSRHDDPAATGARDALATLIGRLRDCGGATCVAAEDDDGGSSGSSGIGDFVWDDVNGNGIQDTGEPGRAAVTVHLRECGGGPVDSTVTDAAGLYLFDLLAADRYTVEFVAPLGFIFSAPNQGARRGKDSNPDAATGVTPCFTVADGQVKRGIDAGLIASTGSGTAGVGDLVWQDLNGDGIQDAGEPGFAGVVVHLRVCNGGVLQSTVSDSAGRYLFDSLAPDRYAVEFEAPSGFVFSPARQGAKRGKDSNPDPATGITPCAGLADGQTKRGVDAGLRGS